MELGTGLALLGSAKLLEKLLGPTAGYVGQGVKTWTQKRVENVRTILRKAAKQLGPRIDEPGAVPPRVLKAVLDDGSFCDDELAAEYFGGVLASSRTEASRDDRGAVFLALVSRLSTYQLRSHYIFYVVAKRLFDGSGLSLNRVDRPKMEVFLPLASYLPALEPTVQEAPGFDAILDHVLWGLHSEGLIDSFSYGPVEEIRKADPAAEDGGILYIPSVLGAELFLWAHGQGGVHKSELLSPERQFVIENPLVIPDGYKRTKWPAT